MTAATLLDGELVRRLRAELGLSARAVAAAAVGVTGNVIARLEAGDNHLELTLGVLSRLAAALREALGWSLQRLRTATTALEGGLLAVGLRLTRVAERYRIVRDDTAADAEELAALLRAHINRDGLNLTEASMLARIERAEAPREPSNPETVAIGTLVNA